MANTNSAPAVTLNITDKGIKDSSNLVAYVVNNSGTLIESVPFKSSAATLKETQSDIQVGQLRIYIAQAFPKGFQEKINERQLIQAGAYAVVQKFINNAIQIASIPTTILNPIIIDSCLIKGTITNNVLINGVEVNNSPVNNARVHIEEIGRRLIWPLPPIVYDTIPDWVIDQIRNEILNLPPVLDTHRIVAERVSPLHINTGRSVDQDSRIAYPTTAIPDDVIAGIKSTSRTTVIQTLADNHELLLPYFCWWPWIWPWFYYIIDDTIVYTDCQGNFDLTELYLPSYPPNIYIWVEVYSNGQWVTAYDPWLPCGTHWDYACGTAININLGNLNILPCGNKPPLAGESVYLSSVNGGDSIRSVQQSATASGHLPNAVGLTAYGSDGNISPFGSALSFWVQFGINLYGAKFGTQTITNYRWSYTQLTDAYLQTPVSPKSGILNPVVNIPYYYYLPAPAPAIGFDEFFGNFQLGPFYDSSSRAMYVIPQSSPTANYPSLPASAQVSLPAGAQDAAWYNPYPLTESISFDSVNLPDGLYEFTFELLDKTGTVVPIPTTADIPFLVDSVPTDNNPTHAQTINADGLSQNGSPENYVIHNAAGAAIGFNFKMRLDNTSCYAGISDAVVNNIVSPPCGIANYTNVNNPVQLIFQAGHPHNFATYSFDVYLGDMGLVTGGANNPNSSGTSANPNAPTPPPPGPIVTTGNNHYVISQVSSPVPTPENAVSNMDEYTSTLLTVQDMLAPSASAPGGPCTGAAFSENLYVAATHTDGVNRLSEYDAEWVAAFALVTPCPKTN